jgi:hypothetical protein
MVTDGPGGVLAEAAGLAEAFGPEQAAAPTERSASSAAW